MQRNLLVSNAFSHFKAGFVESPAEDLVDVTVPETQTPWTFGEQLSPEDRDRIEQVVEEHRRCFAFTIADLGRHRTYKMSIPLTDETPIFRPRHRLSPYEWEIVDRKSEELVSHGMVRESQSPFAAPTVMPAKKDSEGNYTEKRMCGDYRALNLVTEQDRYPMPLPDEIFDQMGGSSIYSILDMRQGFNQIEIEEEDKHKTAYWASNRRYEWNVMPFGLKNAPAVFQKVMDAVLGPISFARCYIDDVIVASSSVAQHCEHLRYIFEVVYDAGLRCHPSKCLFGSTRVPYLGHMVFVDGLGPQQAKIDAIAKMVEPGDASTLRSFLGLANYYRKFVQNYSSIAKPLNCVAEERFLCLGSGTAERVRCA